MLSNEHYPFSVTLAAIVFTHMQVSAMDLRDRDRENTKREQISIEEHLL